MIKINRIINSLLDNDLYKFSMGQCIYHQFSNYTATWTFRCRNKDVKFTSDMLFEIKQQIYEYTKLRFTEDELFYLTSIKWIKPDYINYLRLWHPRDEDFLVYLSPENNLILEARGNWLDTSMYESPVLAIVNEVYFRYKYNYDILIDDFRNKLNRKIVDLNTGKYQIENFSEFGLRRRLSYEAQEYAVKNLKSNDLGASNFVGTSNVLLAKNYDLKPVGTMAHEFLSFPQGDPKLNPAYSNWYAMNAWIKEYGILNGIMLTDIIGDELCRRDMGLTFATLFSGVRNDSGNPYIWTDNWIKHYSKLGIDPTTKTLLFSNSLDFNKANDIRHYVNDRAKVAFGIGTYISNDTLEEPLNIVMKITEMNGHSVAKLSDDEGKLMCKDKHYVDYLKNLIKWRRAHEAPGEIL